MTELFSRFLQKIDRFDVYSGGKSENVGTFLL
jgi:hypothetical protein